MILVSILAMMASPATPAGACLPGSAELAKPRSITISILPRLLGRADLIPSVEQLRASKLNPPPAVVRELEPCDASARVQRQVIAPVDPKLSRLR